MIAYLIVGVLGGLVDDLAAVAKEQAALRRVDAALRRVATLVARAVPTDELFAATTEEVGKLLGVHGSKLARLEPDGTTTILAEWAENGDPIASGTDVVPSDAGENGAISAPIVVEARPWGVMTACASRDRTLPPDTQTRLARFTELLATAIANAQSRDQLAASRARIVAASDHTRRQIERDLHDGAQQRLVSLTLGLRTAQRAVPAELLDLRTALSTVADGLAGVMEELREMARGIHPAVLAEGGIAPALGNLARRSAIPVELQVDTEGRLPEQVEVAVYYLVSESLTNILKHADASSATVVVDRTDRRRASLDPRRRDRRRGSIPWDRTHRPVGPRPSAWRHDRRRKPSRRGDAHSRRAAAARLGPQLWSQCSRASPRAIGDRLDQSRTGQRAAARIPASWYRQTPTCRGSEMDGGVEETSAPVGDSHDTSRVRLNGTATTNRGPRDAQPVIPISTPARTPPASGASAAACLGHGPNSTTRKLAS